MNQSNIYHKIVLPFTIEGKITCYKCTTHSTKNGKNHRIGKNFKQKPKPYYLRISY